MIYFLAVLAASSSDVAAQTSATGQLWEGRWASSPAACQQVSCTGEAECDGTVYSFQDEIFRGVPGYLTCVIAGESSDREYTVLPLACAAEGTAYTTAIRLQLKKDALMIEWARERSSNAEAYEFESNAMALERCPG